MASAAKPDVDALHDAVIGEADALANGPLAQYPHDGATQFPSPNSPAARKAWAAHVEAMREGVARITSAIDALAAAVGMAARDY